MNTHRHYAPCKYCGKQFSSQNLARHEEKCRENPETVQTLKTTFHICESCGKEYSGWDNSNPRFCSKSCARAFSSKFVPLTKEATCVACGKSIEIPSQASLKTALCYDCKKKRYRQRLDFLKAQRRDRRAATYGVVDLNNLESVKVSCSFCGRKVAVQAIAAHEQSCSCNPESSHVKKGYKRADVREGYIYKVTNKLNGRFYIGKKAGQPNSSQSYLGSGLAIRAAIKKYGKPNFIKEILEYIPNGDLSERERFWIQQTGAFASDVGYNLSEGGDGGALFKGKHHTEATKQKLKEKLKAIAAGRTNGVSRLS